MPDEVKLVEDEEPVVLVELAPSEVVLVVPSEDEVELLVTE